MDEKNKPQIMSVLGLPYIRLVTEKILPAEAEKMAQKYHYVHIYSYKPATLPDFVEQKQTISLIDLSQDEETIFKKFKKNTRNEIHKTERIPELSFRLPDPDNKNSYAFYKKIKTGDGVIPDVQQEFTDCLFFNAYFNDQLIVSVSCYDAGNIIRLKHIVSSRKTGEIDPRIIGCASRRLIWEICKYGKHYGYRWFDLAGVNLADQKKTGVARFKQSFGGELRTNYIYRQEWPLFALVRKTLKFLGCNIH